MIKMFSNPNPRVYAEAEGTSKVWRVAVEGDDRTIGHIKYRYPGGYVYLPKSRQSRTNLASAESYRTPQLCLDAVTGE